MQSERHLGYHKPYVARELLEKHPDVDALFYADPDITFIGPWKFFEEWVTCGVALHAGIENAFTDGRGVHGCMVFTNASRRG